MNDPISQEFQPADTFPENRENMLVGGAAGLAAALVGAAVWAAITYYTNYQIGFMAIGVGYLVGLSMQKTGHGSSTAFGVLAAVLAVSGCILGNLFSSCSFLADSLEMPLSELLLSLTPPLAFEILKEGASIMDALFYFFAVSVAFRTSRAGA